MKLNVQKAGERLKLVMNILLIGSGRLSGLGGLSDLGMLLRLLDTIGQAVHLILAVLLDESDQILDGTGTGVFDRRVLRTSGVELDSGEASDRVGHIVGSGVNLGDSDLLIKLGDIGVKRSKLVVLGGKAGDNQLEMRQIADEL